MNAPLPFSRPATPVAPVVDAATVLLLRDSKQGLQVLMVRRHPASKVLGGTYVFPGGKLDASDQTPQALACLSQTPAQLQARLGQADLDAARAAGLFMAALREVFEECGVLAAQGPAGAAQAQRLATHAHPLDWHAAWAQAHRERGERLHTEGLLPWSRWVTPRQPVIGHQRFDTRFFLASACDTQTARHDDVETTDCLWLTPGQALARYACGEMPLIAPQIMSLYQLKKHQSVEQALDEARQGPPPVIEPHILWGEDEHIACYPGDPAHPLRQQAMRGPTRLLFANKLFVPEGGMAQLLD